MIGDLVKKIHEDMKGEFPSKEKIKEYITDEYVERVMNRNCPYCGEKMKQETSVRPSVIPREGQGYGGSFRCKTKDCLFGIGYVLGDDGDYHYLKENEEIRRNNAAYIGKIIALEIKVGERDEKEVVKNWITWHLWMAYDQFLDKGEKKE